MKALIASHFARNGSFNSPCDAFEAIGDFILPINRKTVCNWYSRLQKSFDQNDKNMSYVLMLELRALKLRRSYPL